MMATTAITAQEEASTSVNGNNATLLQASGKYFYYGSQVMNKKECIEFLATRNQEAYKTVKSGYQYYNVGWWTFRAGLGIDLAGSILIAFAPQKDSPAMLYSGTTCLLLGTTAINRFCSNYFHWLCSPKQRYRYIQ